MGKKKFHARTISWFFLVVFAGLLLPYLGQYFFTPAYGAQLQNRSLQLSNDQISVSSDYLISFTTISTAVLGSMTFQFCANDALINDVCTPPAGFDDSNAVLADQHGNTGFSISPSSTANELVLTRAPQVATEINAYYHFTGIVNPSSSGSYYLRIQTYDTADASGPSTDYGGAAFAIVNGVTISAEVPPYLIFCTGITISGYNCANAAGDYIDLGELLSNQASTGTSQMLVASNANNGYAVTAFGTTMTSGNNVIPALVNNDVSRPGVGQFGFNLRANSTPPSGSNPSGPGLGEPTPQYDIPNSYRFNSGDTIIATTAPDNLRQYTASYIVNVPSTQAPGIYVSTITYIALATF